MSSSTNETSTSTSTSGRSSVTYERSDSKKSIKVDDLFSKFSFFSSDSSPTQSDFSAKISDSTSESTTQIESTNLDTKSEKKKLAEDSSLAQSSVKPQTVIKSNSSVANESPSPRKNQSQIENPTSIKVKNAQLDIKSEVKSAKTEVKSPKKVAKMKKSEKQTKKFEREFSTNSGVQGLGRLESKIRVLESTKMKDAYQKKDNKDLQVRNPWNSRMILSAMDYNSLPMVHDPWQHKSYRSSPPSLKDSCLERNRKAEKG